MNFGRKTMKAGVAAVAAIATLGAGGVVASTAFAGGGGGNQPGTGGDLAAVQFWQYKDDASGAWGPATSPSGAATLWVHKALSAGRPLPFGVEVVSRFTVAAPAEEESWRSTSR
ncbi:Hypothetical protein BLD_0381 [Bifidobacterium longum DJO10A]|uniref:Uncharacterized protein n=1 Tax=Bifidobacterium longum (strain DJO10A) TaxID=205913 RepID=B3DRQ8_BIFLD|nr:hypothetical protein [Bifidobacterium longum]ACD97827.1 Hypothetical protein BLD_0381 [Bifidobacterium longum DJO10A]